MAVTTGGQIATTTIDGHQVRGVRAGWELIKRSWPATRVVLVQLFLATAISVTIAFVWHQKTYFAWVFAITATEFICARHHRRLVEIAFGVSIGLLIGVLLNPNWPSGYALSNALIGCGVALLVAVATTPRDPAKLVRTETDPLLGQLSTEIRAMAQALRTGDADAAAEVVKALNQSERGLRSLNETLVQVRRSAPLTKWVHGQDLPKITTAATQLSEAIRGVRSMAGRALYGILRPGEPVPPALPQMVEALADGTALLRMEAAEGVEPLKARQMLASAAQWAHVLREENISLAAASVTADAGSAVHFLLVSTGLTTDQALALSLQPIEG